MCGGVSFFLFLRDKRMSGEIPDQRGQPFLRRRFSVPGSRRPLQSHLLLSGTTPLRPAASFLWAFLRSSFFCTTTLRPQIVITKRFFLGSMTESSIRRNICVRFRLHRFPGFAPAGAKLLLPLFTLHCRCTFSNGGRGELRLGYARGVQILEENPRISSPSSPLVARGTRHTVGLRC